MQERRPITIRYAHLYIDDAMAAFECLTLSLCINCASKERGADEVVAPFQRIFRLFLCVRGSREMLLHTHFCGPLRGDLTATNLSLSGPVL